MRKRDPERVPFLLQWDRHPCLSRRAKRAYFSIAARRRHSKETIHVRVG